MDSGANDYTFQCFLCFLTWKLHPSLLLITINYKKFYLEQQLFTQQKNMSYKETFDKISSQSKVLHPNSREMKLRSNASHTEGQSHFITQFEEPQRATRSTKLVIFQF